MIVWLTGQPGSGKTTIAQALKEEGLVDFIVDGDELRAVQQEGYDERGRHRNVARAQDIALYLHNEGMNVAVALVSPNRAQREWLKERASVLEVHLYASEPRGREEFFADHYEPPRENRIVFDTALCSPADCVDTIRPFFPVPARGPRRATFIGRWQPLHLGHDWLIRQALDAGEPVQVLVRDIPPDEKNPLTTGQTVQILRAAYAGRDVTINVIDDVSAVNYGRGVGYGIVEHVPPENVGAVSATEIRRQISEGDQHWRSLVVPGTENLIARFLRP